MCGYVWHCYVGRYGLVLKSNDIFLGRRACALTSMFPLSSD